MNTFQLVTLVASSIYFFTGAIALHTKNFLSTLLFRVFPFFLGFACLFSVAMNYVQVGQ